MAVCVQSSATYDVEQQKNTFNKCAYKSLKLQQDFQIYK